MKNSSLDQSVRQTVAYYESIIAKMPGHVYWLDEHAFALGGNENVLNMFGFKSVDEFKGLSFEKMGEICNWSLETVNSFKKDSLEVLHTGQAKLNIEEPPITNCQGKLIFFLTSRVPILDINNKVIGVIGISIDITEQKKLEENLKLAKIKTEIADKAKTEFIMNMSHDLRTPLTGIISLASLQVTNGTSVQERQYGQWIYSAAEQLLELLNSVLEVTAAEYHIELIAKDTLHLQQFAEELQALMQPVVVAKGLEFQLKLDSRLPSVITDQIKLKRIILNLLSNAVKFTKQGKIGLEITALMIKKDEAKIEIRITDTGIGITKDKLDKIFDRFYRVHPSYQAEYSGYGIGLFLVKKAVKLLGGKIKVTSETDKGSCFSLEFIFPVVHNVIAKVNSEIAHSESVQLGKVNGAVLVAEDNTLVLFAVKNILTNLGFDVTTVTEGKAALHALQNKSFVWALLDIGLPDLDGTEIVRCYRQWEQKNNKYYLPIFSLTAHIEKDIIDKCKEVGFDYVLKKPFTEKDIQMIKKILEEKNVFF